MKILLLAKFTSLVRARDYTELSCSHVPVKDCHSDVTPVNNSDSDVFTLDTIAFIMERRRCKG